MNSQPLTTQSNLGRQRSSRALRRWGAGALALFMLCGSLQAELVYSKSRRFRIPFQFDAAELQRLGTREIQLYVSRDGGNNWAKADSVSPETSRFTFEAPEDGVYWFSVKTVSGSGLIYPAGPHQSGLNVLVDSTQPVLDLQLEEVQPGRVRLTWIADDAHLDLSTLKLEFREPNADVWSAVAIRAQERGQTTWTTTGSGQVQVRGEVADLAGNSTQAFAECNTEVPPPRNDQPDYGRPVANDVKANAPVIANMPSSSPAMTPRLTSTPTPGSQVVKELSDSQPTAEANSPAQGTPPPAETPRNPFDTHHQVNSNIFRIGYSIDEVGPSGVKQVDLYITEDNGKKWFHYGQDPDRVSPMEVTVPRDGVYGFAFRVMNGLGRVDIPPQPGDPPDVLVTVDRVPPVVKLQPLEHGQDLDQNKVIISWTASDQNLGENPVALFYSVAPTGPWEAIQSWQPNSGRMVWTVPASLNQQFYIRLDVRDKAGNVTRVYGEQPFLVDRSQPRARITEVQSLGNTAR